MVSQWVYLVIAIVPSVILHEVAHGFVANYFGDDTAKRAGRLTLNPLAHIDPFGTVLLPLIMIFTVHFAFGYAKPVPVNTAKLRNPRTQALYVSLAGPFVNIVLSAAGWIVCHFAITSVGGQLEITNLVLFNVGFYFGIINMFLAIFNLLPIPPLDGSAIIERLIPRSKIPAYYHFRARAMPFMFLAVLGLFYFTNLGTNVFNDLQNWWLNTL